MNIAEITLPSNGNLPRVPAKVTIREMTGAELTAIYSNFNDEIIDEIVQAVIETEGINIEDLAEQDKHMILHQTRVLSFGNTITQTLRCPFCGVIHDYEIDYGTFKATLIDDEYLSKTTFEIGKHTYVRKIPTVRDFKRIRDTKQKYSISFKDDFILAIMVYVDTVDGRKMPDLDLLNHLKDLPAKDLKQVATELAVKFGLDTTFTVECEDCHNAITGGLGISPNLF